MKMRNVYRSWGEEGGGSTEVFPPELSQVESPRARDVGASYCSFVKDSCDLRKQNRWP